MNSEKWNEVGPFIEINATDLATGLRFTFNQERFDPICSDLGSYSIARAVTASSAVPVAFPTVVLENHASECDVSESETWRIIENFSGDGEAQTMMKQGLKSYRDSAERKYIHLVDGGIADNLGLRATARRQWTNFGKAFIYSINNSAPRVFRRGCFLSKSALTR